MTDANYKRITCAQCSIEFQALIKRKFCGTKCRDRAKVLRRNPNAGTKQPAKYARNCKLCGKAFTYHPSGKDKGHEHERGLYCSMACKVADYAPSKPLQYSAIYSGYCVTCGNPFVTRRKRMYCRDDCRASSAFVSVAPDVRQCKCCGETYKPVSTGGRPVEYCSDKCSELVKTAAKRVSRLKRKAKQRAASVESVDPLKVFERDKWRCQLCGVKTPKSKRGTYDNNAPELDHIIPLSKGGEHSYRNTQCACRKCNAAKSDSVLGQLLLIG